MQHQGYILITSIVRNNVLGAVIAPKGTEDYPKHKRFLVWRVFVRPLIEEVAEHETFPQDDVDHVLKELARYCMEEGIACRLDGDEGSTNL